MGEQGGEIGFAGLLLSDDLSMSALGGTPGERATAVLAAGCDVALHCNGRLEEMREVADAVPLLDGPAHERYASALARRLAPDTFDVSEALQILAQVLAVSEGRASV